MGDSEKYWVSKDGENLGPFELDQIQEKIEEGSLSPSDYLCEVGADEWVSLSESLNIPDGDGEESDSQQIVLEGGSGGSLNAFLTVFFALLVIVCVGFFLFARFSGSEEVEQKVVVPEFDLRSIEKNATDASNFELRDGRTFLRAEESAFSGWSIQRFSGTGEVANLVRFENGMAVKAHSWKPNREKCPDTTLTGGSGSVFVYFDNGNRAGESHYTQGQLNGMKVTWYENGEKSQEAFYQHGKLNGVFVKRHRNGQKIEETNYSDDLENGSYSLWTNKGQKIEEGSYLAGKRDGKRTIWTPDGIKDREETYLDGKLVSTPDAVPVQTPVGNVPVPFDASNESPEIQKKAEQFKQVVAGVKNRFSEKNALGSESFATLASALFLYASPKADPDQAYPGEADNFAALKGAFSQFRINWGMNLGVGGKDFALSVIPESVAYGGITLTREEFLAGNPVPLGPNSLEDLDFILEETQKIFDSMELSLEKDSSHLKHEFAKQIWQDLVAKSEGAKGANLFVKNGIPAFKDVETVQIKSIDSTGRSVFTDEKKEVDRVFTVGIVDKKMGKYLSVLESANVTFSDAPSEANPRLMIRKYESLVLPSGGNEDVYPNVTIMLAGIAPLNKNTVIRAVKVDLGQPLSPPVAE